MSGTLPSSPTFNAINLRSAYQTLVSESQSNKTQVRSFGGHRWEFIAQYPQMTKAQFRPIYAFIHSQKGRYDAFKVVIPDMKTPLGNGGGTPRVNGAGQTGNTLAVDGCTPHATWLKAGDIFTISGDTKVYMLTEDAATNGSPEGQTILRFEPELVVSPSDDAALTVSNVAFTVRLKNDVQEYRGVPHLYTFELDLVEAL